MLKSLSMSAKKSVSEMMNLGPKCEEDFNTAGIFYAEQIIKMGARKSFLKMLDGRLALNKSAKCVNAIYLYAIYGAIHEIDWQDTPEDKKKEFKAFTKELRESGRYI